MWIVLYLFINIVCVAVCFVENRVSVQLFSEVRHFQELKGSSKFPDVESLFRIEGKNVKSL